ncbi:MAG: Rieske 2Fe-2S domain-containing protein [Sulfurimonas sp.]|jgi:Rieske Fe-S protein|nr:Rieske 2Fe-2S domain-containing protein [Sulfurimonas sp.]
MDRRNFLRVVGATGALVAISPSTISGRLYASNGLYESYERVQLLNADGVAIKLADLKKETNYIFQYPYIGTPTMLLDLEDSTAKDVRLKSDDGEEYIWKGGVGKDRTVVAYSAICSHQLAHPTPDDSFLQYVQKDKKTMACDHGGVVVCSSHLSSFEAKEGCKNISGPASAPLAAVVLEIADDDTIYAVGVLGGDKFHEYFKAYKPEFKKYYGNARQAKKKVTKSATMVELTQYTKEIIQY